jgi:tetratricopeptide (TPR) repeat protein/predicted Ser/Thr protein kinase
MLGRGGMGVVYSAYDPELDRRVALKLLLPRGDEKKRSRGRVRLVREAQALARLSHPNVVTVHDVGEHDGQVFIAMEFIDGDTLKRWIKKGPHPWKQAVEVLSAAGRGLSAAHAKRMTHRDFKPDNVMLEADSGRVVVMDFGLATAPDIASLSDVESSLSSSLSSGDSSDGLTRTGAVMGTPAYMAPDQHAGQPTAASDQFSFCVTLYEALYGHRPFAGTTLPAVMGAALRGEFRPTPQRSSVPRWLREVVVRGLAGRPRDRWPSMDALLQALQNDPSRRRWAFGGAAGLVLVVGGLYTSNVVRDERRQADCEKRSEAVDAMWNQAKRDRIANAFASLDLSYAEDVWARTEEKLDRSARRWQTTRLETCLAEPTTMPALRSATDACLDARLRSLQTVLRVLSDADGNVVPRATAIAELDIDECTDEAWLLEAPRLPDDPATRDTHLRMRQELFYSSTLRAASRIEEAAALQEALVSEAKELGEARLLAEARYQLGKSRSLQTRYKESAQLHEDAYFAAMEVSDRKLARLTALALIESHGQRLADATTGRLWARHGQLLVDAHPNAKHQADLDQILAQMEFTAGHFDRALELSEGALAVFVDELGETSDRATSSRELLLAIYDRLGKTNEAIEMSRAVLSARLDAYGEKHPYTLTARSNLAAALITTRELDEAEAQLRMVIEAINPPNLDAASAMDNLSLVLMLDDQVEAAVELNTEVLSIRRRLLSDTHLRVAHTLTNRANMVFRLRDFDGMIEAAREAREIYRETVPEDSPYLVFPDRQEGGVLLSLGRSAEALPLLARAFEHQQRVVGPDSEDTLALTNQYSMALLATGKARDALALTQPWLDGTRPLDEMSEDTKLQTREMHANTLLALDRATESIELLDTLLAELRRSGCCDDSIPMIELTHARARWAANIDRPASFAKAESVVEALEREDNPENMLVIRRGRAWLETHRKKG